MRRFLMIAFHAIPMALSRPSATTCSTLALVEALARMYWQALQIGEPALLDEAEMRLVIDKFQTYGQQPL